MNRIALTVCTALTLMAMTTPLTAVDGGSRIGAGVHYWTVLEDIDIDDVDESGIGWVIAYQNVLGPLFKFEVDLEILPERFSGAGDTVYAPQGLLLVGSTIYAGLGIGTYYADGDFSDNPFYTLRGGLDLELIPGLHLDINANYRVGSWDDLDEALDELGTDTLTLAALLRLEL